MTPVQASLLDALEARDNALARVEAAAPSEWKKRALDAVYALCCNGHPFVFTSENVWALIEKPSEARALGPVLRRAVANGWCVPEGFVQSGMVSRHAAPVREYRSCLR